MFSAYGAIIIVCVAAAITFAETFYRNSRLFMYVQGYFGRRRERLGRFLLENEDISFRQAMYYHKRTLSLEHMIEEMEEDGVVVRKPVSPPAG